MGIFQISKILYSVKVCLHTYERQDIIQIALK
jgi:hypothetical protein